MKKVVLAITVITMAIMMASCAAGKRGCDCPRFSQERIEDNNSSDLARQEVDYVESQMVYLHCE